MLTTLGLMQRAFLQALEAMAEEASAFVNTQVDVGRRRRILISERCLLKQRDGLLERIRHFQTQYIPSRVKECNVLMSGKRT
jgi:hypothetical protein